MEGLDLTSLYTTIGGALGTPAALAFFWLWNKVKELEKRLDAGQTRFDRMDAELKEINKSLNIIIGKVDTMLRRSGSPNFKQKELGRSTPPSLEGI